MVPFAGVELLEAGGGMAITSVSDNTNILVRALMVIMHLWSQGKAVVMSEKKVLVAGASGLVGFAAIKHFSQLPDWNAVGVSRRIPPGLEKANLRSI